MFSKASFFGRFLVLSTFLGACSTGQASATEQQAPEREQYEVDGEVRRVERERRSITIAHEDVPGYMPAMTMPFSVDDVALLEGLAEGDRVHFTFEPRAGGAHFITEIRKL